MVSERSVTKWLQEVQQCKQGEAQEQLLQRFLRRLTALARTKLRDIHAYEDEEDVALSALKTLFLRAPKGEFTRAKDRGSLWSLLAAITINKAISAQRRHLAEKRDVRRAQSLDTLLQAGPTEDFLDLMMEESNRWLDAIEDPALRDVARLRMEGYSNREIAEQIGKSETTVERKLRVIRTRLKTEFESRHE